jgi:hypothetical protein
MISEVMCRLAKANATPTTVRIASNTAGAPCLASTDVNHTDIGIGIDRPNTNYAATAAAAAAAAAAAWETSVSFVSTAGGVAIARQQLLGLGVCNSERQQQRQYRHTVGFDCEWRPPTILPEVRRQERECRSRLAAASASASASASGCGSGGSSVHATEELDGVHDGSNDSDSGNCALLQVACASHTFLFDMAVLSDHDHDHDHDHDLERRAYITSLFHLLIELFQSDSIVKLG